MAPPPRRLLSIGALAAAVAVAVAGAALLMATRDGGPGGGGPELRAGTVLEGRPAPDVALTDHTGQPRSLSSLRGRVVVVTFLFTNCPDVCPLTADKLAAADRRLASGGSAEGVAYLAVTLDPDRDTPEARAQFLASHGLPAGRAFFVSGPKERLEEVWAAYGIGRQAAAERVAGEAGGDHHELQHTDAMFLVDAEGRERELVRSDVAVGDLAADLAALVDAAT